MRISNKLSNKTILGIAWGSFAAITLGAMIIPSFTPEETKAATQIDASIHKTGYYLNLSSTTSSIDMDVTPSTDGTLASAKDSLNVKTNIPSGYNLYISATSGGAVQNSLYNSITKPGETPASITASTATPATATTLTNNTWGFGIPTGTEGLVANQFTDATSYSTPTPSSEAHWAGIPAKGSGSVPSYARLIQTINHNNDYTEGNNVDIYYGTKINSSLPSGLYTGNVVYTAVAEEPPEPVNLTFDEAYNFFGKTKDPATNLYKMQDMEQDICNAVKDATDTTAAGTQMSTLVDTRDGKTYGVAKLKDGKCWMNQNLDLNLDNSTPLTSELSDISTGRSWTPQTTYTATSQWTSTDYDNLNSIDMGNYYYDGSTIDNDHTSGTTYSNFNGFSTTGNFHYHVGNLYSWNAATANSRQSSAGAGEATDSICPKGWRLPTGGDSGEFKALIDAQSVGSTVQTLINEPLYMVRGGYVNSGQLRYAANSGRYWASTAISSHGGYEFSFGSTSGVYPIRGYDRYLGQSVRCLAR